MTNTYIQDKLDELDDRFAIIIDEKIDDKIYKNIDYGDFYGRRDEFKDFIKEIFVDYQNHIVEKLKDYFDEQGVQEFIGTGAIELITKDKLQDTNTKE